VARTTNNHSLSLLLSRDADPLVSRGPAGFCTEEMGISLQSIPHQRVEYFTGTVLVLSLSSNDCQALLTDSRFKWQLPPTKGDLNFGGWQIIYGDRYDVVISEQNTGRLFALDKTRLKLAMCQENGEFFKVDR
jgi:hypothetical protein